MNTALDGDMDVRKSSRSRSNIWRRVAAGATVLTLFAAAPGAGAGSWGGRHRDRSAPVTTTTTSTTTSTSTTTTVPVATSPSNTSTSSLSPLEAFLKMAYTSISNYIAEHPDLGFGAGHLWQDDTGQLSTRADVLSAINGDGVRDTGLTGKGVDVAIIDTGVAPVSGLEGDAIINGPDLSLDYQAGMPVGVDGFGHGTHLGGIIAGRDGGIAPGSQLVNLKVGAADGAVDVSQVIAAIDWVVTHRNDEGMNIKVLNLAYGTDSTQGYESSPLTHAVESAWNAGIVVVVSAGNSGADLVNPATDPFVMTVGAIDSNSPTNYYDDKIAEYSSVGSEKRGIDILAPGTSILSSRVPGSFVDETFPESQNDDGSQTKGSGTSQAAAVVSGSVALLLEQRPDLTPNQVKALLQNSARQQWFVPAYKQGGGVIDLGRALYSSTPKDKAQTFTRSNGLGPIEAARGTAHLEADDGSILTGEIDVQGAPWNPKVWAPLSTTGSAWTDGIWNGSEWTGNGWDTTTASGDNWEARSWRARSWRARSWRADLWAARSWRSETWEARSWRGDHWE